MKITVKIESDEPNPDCKICKEVVMELESGVFGHFPFLPYWKCPRCGHKEPLKLVSNMVEETPAPSSE